MFGGAFDPPHLGHVELARVGIDHFDLDRLLVRVVEEPGHKDVRDGPADPTPPRRACIRAARRGRDRSRPVRPHGRLARGVEPRRSRLPRRGGRVRDVARLEGARARARAGAARGCDQARRRPEPPRERSRCSRAARASACSSRSSRSPCPLRTSGREPRQASRSKASCRHPCRRKSTDCASTAPFDRPPPGGMLRHVCLC